MIVSPSWTPSSKMPLQAYPHHASPLLSIHRDQLYSQVAAWFGRSLAVTLAMVSIHLSFQQYLGGEEAAASNEMSMIFKSYWRNTFDASMYGSSAVLTLLFCSTFFALLYGSRRLGSHPLCVPALLLITRLHIFLVTLGLVPQRSFVSEQAGYFALHLDGLRDALLPSIGMPLTWPSQLLLRLVFEALQAAYMFRIVRTDIRATALIFAARFSVSASVGFVCDLLQRRSFLQSEAAAKQDYALANPAVDHNGGAERPFDTAPPSRSLSMTSFGGSTFSEPRPTLELDPSVVYNDTGVSVTRVVLKSSHTDEDAPLPVFEKAELHTRIINEGFTSYSMSLVSVSVRRGCFIVEVVMAKKPESIVKIDCLQALQTLQLEKHLKVGSKVSIRVEESQLGQVFKLGQDKRWDRISIAPPPTAFPQLSLALTPRAFLVEKRDQIVLRGRWSGPKLDEGSSLEAVFRGQALPVTSTPPCCDWGTGEEVKVVVSLAGIVQGRGRPHGSLDINVWSKPRANNSDGEDDDDLPALVVSTFSAVALPPGSHVALRELEGPLTCPQNRGLLKDLSLVLNSDDSQPPYVFSKVAQNLLQWGSTSHRPALVDLISMLLRSTDAAHQVPGVPDAWKQAQKQLTGATAVKEVRQSSTIAANIQMLMTGTDSQVPVSWTVSILIICLTRMMTQIIWRFGAASVEPYIVIYTAIPYFLHVLIHIAPSMLKDSNGLTARVLRAFQRHAGLVLLLHRHLVILWICFGLPHDLFSLKRLSPFNFNALYLTLRTTFHALEPIPVKVYLTQLLLVEAPVIFLFATTSRLDVQNLLLHLVRRFLAAAVTYGARQIVLQKIASSCKKKM